ncbi:hypothetical protein [Wohlfahrtiimonas larvae]|uniref:CopG family transcriptional regulator n=1 Tax=Wohlfahrtiimonas larvae TaxID=1157986 RepID=A0ABP9MS63_9GAMM|nr:hypothetical protein [Wohlfahrtiimonas larvae]
MKNTNITPLSRSVNLRIRVTETEHNQLKRLASKEGKPVATVAHALLIRALKYHS